MKGTYLKKKKDRPASRLTSAGQRAVQGRKRKGLKVKSGVKRRHKGPVNPGLVVHGAGTTRALENNSTNDHLKISNWQATQKPTLTPSPGRPNSQRKKKKKRPTRHHTNP